MRDSSRISPPPEASGVAGTVHRLVMLKGDLRNGPREVDLSQDGMSRLRVAPNYVEFHVRKASGLAQDLGGHGNLPDVVEQPGHPQPLQSILVQPHLPPDANREIRDPALVTGRIRVSHLYNGRHAWMIPSKDLLSFVNVSVTRPSAFFRSVMSRAMPRMY